jgi:hypothetical protein
VPRFPAGSQSAPFARPSFGFFPRRVKSTEFVYQLAVSMRLSAYKIAAEARQGFHLFIFNA